MERFGGYAGDVAFSIADNGRVAVVRYTPGEGRRRRHVPGGPSRGRAPPDRRQRQPALRPRPRRPRGDHVRFLRRQGHPGLDPQAAGLRPGEEIPAHARHPRRAARHVRRRVQPAAADLRRPRLRGAVHQSARLHRLRRGVRQHHPHPVPGRRLQGPDARRGCGDCEGLYRSQAAGRHRRQRRRPAHGVDHRPHRPLRRGRLAVSGDQLDHAGGDRRRRLLSRRACG